MKDIIKEFLEVFASMLCIVCIGLGAYSLFINLYHADTIAATDVVNLNDSVTHQNVMAKMNSIETKINTVDLEKMGQNDTKLYFLNIYGSLNRCINATKSTAFYQTTGVITINSVYVYQELQNFYNEFYNKCLLTEMNSIFDLDERFYYDDTELEKIKPTYKMAVSEISNDSSYLIGSLLINTSYSHVTSLTRMTIFNQNTTAYGLLGQYYSDTIDLVEIMADWYVNEGTKVIAKGAK